MSHACIALAFLATLSAQGDNLLANPGFEQIEVTKPAQWDLFVMPQDGPDKAEGRVDDQVFLDGTHSVMLRTTVPYKKEPANNWSQNIIANVAGKELDVHGCIKTDDATEAAFWVQCWSKQPWEVLSAATSSSVTFVGGTHDWTPVQMKVTVPEGTDYVVLRCVLKGTGTAWFDSLKVSETDTTQVPRHPAEKDATAVAPPRPSATATAEKPPAGLVEEVLPGSLEAVAGLVETQNRTAETNRTLRQMNESLKKQIKALQEDIESVREQLKSLPAQPAEAPPAPASTAGVSPPIPENTNDAPTPAPPKPQVRAPRGFILNKAPSASVTPAKKDEAKSEAESSPTVPAVPLQAQGAHWFRLNKTPAAPPKGNEGPEAIPQPSPPLAGPVPPLIPHPDSDEVKP